MRNYYAKAAKPMRLWRNWKERRDVRSRDRLVLAYAPMVRYIASRKVRELPAHCELDDLASAGLVALMEAIDRFDPTKGASFEQYAWTRVAVEHAQPGAPSIRVLGLRRRTRRLDASAGDEV